jgi:hypothetical protein
VRFELPAVLVLVTSCSGDKGTPPEQNKPTDQPIAFVSLDGGARGHHAPDPAHPDQVEPPVTPQPLPSRERRAIDVTLRSSPPGARVAVDGTPVGNAPAFWSGYADGREHEFTFTLPKHAVARYRFVPVSSGVIHARLEPIAEERDAGVTPPPEVVPNPPASAVVPPPAPPIVTSDAAVVAPLPSPGSAQPPQGSAPPPSSAPGPQP